MRIAAICLAGALLAGTRSEALAQTYAMDHGVWIIGGSANISHSHTESTSYSNTGISLFPQVGYFLAPGLAGVIDLSYSHLSSSSVTESAWGIGPGLTYYFRNGTTKLHPYLAASVLYQHATQTLKGPPDNSNSAHYFDWTGSGGLALLLARNVAVTGELFYTAYTYAADGGTSSETTNQYGLRFGISLFLY